MEASSVLERVTKGSIYRQLSDGSIHVFILRFYYLHCSWVRHWLAAHGCKVRRSTDALVILYVPIESRETLINKTKQYDYLKGKQ